MSVVRRLAAAVLVTAAAGVVVPLIASAPADAAGCPSAHGVTVVVEHNGLGGGTAVACDAGGSGKVASAQFRDAGHSLTYAQRQPGFVCRVDGMPASDPCVNTSPADAYWGLWWSDGTTGKWTYSSLGADSLKVPDGGYVDFVWHSGSGTTAPGTAPAPHAASPTPTPTPTHSATATPTHSATPAPTHSVTPTQSPGATHSSSVGPQPTASTASSSPTSTATTSAPASAATSDSPSPSGTSSSKAPTAAPSSPSATTAPPSAAVTPSDPSTTAALVPGTDDDQSGGSEGGMPTWVPILVILLLFGVAGGFAVARRRP